jgi:hypothetical protein
VCFREVGNGPRNSDRPFLMRSGKVAREVGTRQEIGTASRSPRQQDAILELFEQ